MVDLGRRAPFPDDTPRGGSPAPGSGESVHPHRHHPADPNVGLVRMRLAPGAMLAGVIAVLVTAAALGWLAYAVRAH